MIGIGVVLIVGVLSLAIGYIVGSIRAVFLHEHAEHLLEEADRKCAETQQELDELRRWVLEQQE